MLLLEIVVTKGSSKSARGGLVFRLRRFFSRPLHEKSRSIYAHWRRVFPSLPFPVWLSFGAWFIGRNDLLGSSLTYDGFEVEERAFLGRFLQKGMTVLDIGAHHGFYTLLCSSIVGWNGKVFAFEPSPRELKALRLNVFINRLNNVSIQAFAVGDLSGESQMYIVDGEQTGFNSLRHPVVSTATTLAPVVVRTLDDLIGKRILGRPDFIKLDVEGAELSVIQGASELLSRQPRPVIMAEVEEVRTGPWGYRASDIIKSLQDLNFCWFKPVEGGRLRPLKETDEELVGNFIAIPLELLGAVLERVGATC